MDDSGTVYSKIRVCHSGRHVFYYTQ